ncbi:hypothetical protein N9W34_06640 [Rickettsiales bacterium]|nr:hypothetical protein [Rickettsiales bacterium]
MKKILVCLSAFLISSCSVFQAGSINGVTEDQIKSCQDKNCILGLQPEILQSTDGIVTYRVKRPAHPLNLARAMAHAAADVLTIGVWEYVGTPMEGYISSKRDIIFRVTYENEKIDNIQIQKPIEPQPENTDSQPNPEVQP